MDARLRTLRGLIPLLAAAAVLAASPAGSKSPVPDFRRITGEAVRAAKAGDFKTAEARFAEADRLLPNYPPLLLRWAQTAWQDGDKTTAHALMQRFAALGLRLRLPVPGLTIPIEADPAFADVRTALERNTRVLGEAGTLFTLTPSPFIAESVAWDAARHRWLVSSVHRRTIVTVDAQGRQQPFLAPDAGLWGVFNILVDAKRGVLWASTSALPQVEGFTPADKGRTELVRIDLKSGRVLARFAPPPGAERSLGDLALGPDGSVYVSDSGAGGLFRLRPGARALEAVVQSGAFESPQGIVPTPDGRRLIVADYPSGLQQVDLKTGTVTPVAAPADAAMVWLDSLVRDGTSLIAVQNSTDPQRVLRLHMDAGFTRVVRVEVLSQNQAGVGDLTGGVILGRDYVFVGASQWAAFGDDGKLDDKKLRPAVVVRLKLR